MTSSGDAKQLEKPISDHSDCQDSQASGSCDSCEPSTNAGFVLGSPRSSHLPLFVQMSPLRSDWSHAGLKGVIPSVLHYSLLGYNFFIPDAVGNNFFSAFSAIPGFSAEICAAIVQARGARGVRVPHLA